MAVVSRMQRRRVKSWRSNQRRTPSGKQIPDSGSDGGTLSVTSTGPQNVAMIGLPTPPNLQTIDSDAQSKRASNSPTSPKRLASEMSEMSVRGLLSRVPGNSSPSPSPQRGRTGDERTTKSSANLALRLLQAQQREAGKESEKKSPNLSAVLTGHSIGELWRKREGRCELTISIKLNEQEEKDEAAKTDDVRDEEDGEGDGAGGSGKRLRCLDKSGNGDKQSSESDSGNGITPTSSEKTSEIGGLRTMTTGSEQALPTHSPPSTDNQSSSSLPPPSLSLPPGVTSLPSVAPKAPSTSLDTHTVTPSPSPTQPLSLPHSSSLTNGTRSTTTSSSFSGGGGVNQLVTDLCTPVGGVGDTTHLPLLTTSVSNSAHLSSNGDFTTSINAHPAYNGTGTGSEWFQNESTKIGRETSPRVNGCGHLDDGGVVTQTMEGSVGLMMSHVQIPTIVPVASEYGSELSSLSDAHHQSPLSLNLSYPKQHPHPCITSTPPTEIPSPITIVEEEEGDRLSNTPHTTSPEYLPAVCGQVPSSTTAVVASFCHGTSSSSSLSELTSYDSSSFQASELSSLTPDSPPPVLGQSNDYSLSSSPPHHLSSSPLATTRTPQCGEVTMRECRVNLKPLGREWTPRKRRSSSEIELLPQKPKEPSRLEAGGSECTEEETDLECLHPKRLRFSREEDLLDGRPIGGAADPFEDACKQEASETVPSAVPPNLEIAQSNIDTFPLEDKLFSKIDPSLDNGGREGSSEDDDKHVELVVPIPLEDTIETETETHELDTHSMAECSVQQSTDSTLASQVQEETELAPAALPSPPVEVALVTTSTEFGGAMEEATVAGGEEVGEREGGGGGEEEEGGEREVGGGEEERRGEMKNGDDRGEEEREGERGVGGEEEGERENGDDRGEEEREGEREAGGGGGWEEKEGGGGREGGGRGEEGERESGGGAGWEGVEVVGGSDDFGWLHILAQVAVEASPDVESDTSKRKRGEDTRSESPGIKKEADSNTTEEESCIEVGSKISEVATDEGIKVPRPRRVCRPKRFSDNDKPSSGVPVGRGGRRLRGWGRTVGGRRKKVAAESGRVAAERKTATRLIGKTHASLVLGTAEEGVVDVTELAEAGGEKPDLFCSESAREIMETSPQICTPSLSSSSPLGEEGGGGAIETQTLCEDTQQVSKPGSLHFSRPTAAAPPPDDTGNSKPFPTSSDTHHSGSSESIVGSESGSSNDFNGGSSHDTDRGTHDSSVISEEGGMWSDVTLATCTKEPLATDESIKQSSPSPVVSTTSPTASPPRLLTSIPTKHDSFHAQSSESGQDALSPSESGLGKALRLVVGIPLEHVDLVHHRSLQCYSTSQFRPGDVVWAKAPQLPGWPGAVISHTQWKKNRLKQAPPGKVGCRSSLISVDIVCEISPLPSAVQIFALIFVYLPPYLPPSFSLHTYTHTHTHTHSEVGEVVW